MKVAGHVHFDNALNVKLLKVNGRRGRATILVTQHDGFIKEYALAVGDSVELSMNLEIKQ